MVAVPRSPEALWHACTVAWLGLLLAARPAPAQDAAGGGLEPVVPARYSFNRETIRHARETDDEPIYADPKLTKLIDGKKDAQARKVIWRAKGWTGGRTLDIEFFFDQPVDLRRVIVHSFRRRAYAVRRIQVFGQGEQDEAIVGDVVFDQDWRYPPKPDMPRTKVLALAVPCQPSVVTQVRVRVHVVSYLGLAEVEFMAAPMKASAASPTSAYRVPPRADGAQFRVLKGDFNQDGHQDFLMENAHVAYIVDPRVGGVVNYALNKRTGVNLVKPNAAGSWGGLFADRMYPQGRNDFFTQAYTGEVVTDTPDRVAVRVRGNGRSGRLLHITFEKTYSLHPDGPALRVDYRVHNGQDNVADVDYGAWVLNGMGSTQEATRVFWADQEGPRELKDLGTQYVYEPRRGWLGMLTDSGSGIAMLCEYRRTASFLLWRSGDFSTVEFKMGRYPIPAGDSLAMTAWAVPFHGIDAPHGASEAMVGSIDGPTAVEAPPTNMAFALKPNRPGTFTIVVESRRLPDGEWRRHEQKDAALGVMPARMTASLRLDGSGTYLFRVRALERAQEVFAMERRVVVGKASAEYVMEPACKRYLPQGAKDKAGRIDYHALSYQTKHVPWAKSWAGGKPRVLFLPRRRAGVREAVELAQRFEMDCHTNYLPRSMEARCLYDLADFAGRLNASQLLAALKTALTKEAFDAIVVPGDLWKDLPEAIRERILGVVRKGAGLVLLAPEYTPTQLDGLVKLTRPEAKARRIRGAWRRAANHFITDGVPFEALPETLALPYRMGGDVLATIGDAPLVAVGKLGAGRVAVASWVVAGLRRNSYHQTHGGVGLLPNMLALGSQFSCDSHYWEYQMSLLMRMVYWAAKTESLVRGSVEIDEVGANGAGRAVLRLRGLPGRSERVTVKWALRDRFSRKEDSGRVRDVPLTTDGTQIPVAFSHALLNGPIYFEAVVESEGKTSWWGTAVGRVSAAARVEEVSLTKRVWKRDESLAGVVRLTADVADGLAVVEGIDSYGRVFARREVPAAETPLGYTLPLRDCLGLTGHVVARLVVDGKTLSESRQPFVVYHVPDATRMQVAFGWPCVSPEGQRRFLHKDYYRRLSHLGATAIRSHFVGAFEWFEARSLGLPTLKSRAGAGIGGKHPDTRDPSKGKLGLLRKPCLSAPDFQEKLVTGNARVTTYEDAGVLYRGMGDEINSIGPWDGCFSPDCQAAFRTWLKERYGSLSALNREWAASYETWDKVAAMTLDEAKGRSSLAPWVDHRLFNYWNWARSMAAVLKGIRRSNPDIRLGFSGTQETKPWNAYDWWQICQSVSAVAAYRGEQVVQRRSFSRDMYSMSWIGYTATAEQLQERVLSRLFDGDSGFNVYSGRFMINPDYTIPDPGEWLRRALAMVGGGRAEVIMGSRHDAVPVAIHYSPASVCVDEALGIGALRAAETTGARRLLLEQSADYDYLAYAQLEKGHVKSLDGRTYRVLVLPASTAMSDKECETVQRWVADGGVLVGGFGTATRTEHGRLRHRGGLDSVFGLRRSRSQVRSGQVQVVAADRAHGVELDGFEMPAEHVELGLAPNGAQVLAWATQRGGRLPAAFVNRYEAGTAVYLAADVISTYGVWGATRRMASRARPAGGMDRFMKSVLRLAQVPPRPVPLTEANQRLACTRVVMRRRGALRLVGVLRDSQEAQNLDPKPHTVTLGLGRPYHVYDLVTRRYAGRTGTYRDTFGPSTHRALVLLPYEVKGLEIAGPPAVRRGDTAVLRVRVQAEAANLADHSASVDVRGPAGAPRRGYANLIVLHRGVGAIRLPMALNAPVGEWKVTVTDAIANCSETARIVVAE